MSTRSRLSLRSKNKNSNPDGNKSIDNFVQKKSKDVHVIEDDDEEDDLQIDEYAFQDESIQRPLRRKKKAILEDSDNDDMPDMTDMDDNERYQMKEALRQSRIELENDKKRREIYQNIVKRDIAMSSTVVQDLPSSPIDSSNEQLRCDSPDLFGPTPQSHPELERPFQNKNLSTKQTKADDKQSEFCFNNTEQHRLTKDSKKRKYSVESVDYNEQAKENPPSIASESRKRQKTIKDNFTILTSTKQQCKEKKELKHCVMIIDNADSESDSRNTSTTKPKRARVTLRRRYKARIPIKTIKDAMKARLYFAPPGFDHTLYAYAIRKMLDYEKECIRKIHQRCPTFIKWSSPIVAGPREEDCLDAKKEKRRPNYSRKESLNVPEVRRRTRSSVQPFESPKHSKTNQNTTVKQEKEENILGTNSKNVGYVSDDSEDELTKPAFNAVGNYTGIHKEYNVAVSTARTFGVDINTSATRAVQDKENGNNMTENDGKHGNASLAFENKNKKVDVKCESPLTMRETRFDNVETCQESVENSTVNELTSSQREQLSDGIYNKLNQNSIIPKENGVHAGETSTAKMSKDGYDSDVTIDSEHEVGNSAESGNKRPLNKTAVINDDIPDHITVIDSNDAMKDSTVSNPGESLSSASGYLKVKRTSPSIQRKHSKAAQKAAEAAEKRIKQDRRSSANNPSVMEDPREELSECPMCFALFPLQEIDIHAFSCDGVTPASNQSVASFSKSQYQQLSSSYTHSQSQEYGLKDLKVVVERSPEAQSRLEKKKGTEPEAKAGTHREDIPDIVDMTTDDSDEEKTNRSHQEASRSHGFKWLTTESQEERLKSKFKVTYGRKKATVDKKNPFKTQTDYVPLKDDSSSEESTVKEQSKIQKPKNTVNKGNCMTNIDSNSDSEADILGTYCINKPKTAKSINDVLFPQKQSRKMKKNKAYNVQDDENEKALLQLAGALSDGECSDEPERSSKPTEVTQTRRKRATISSDDSEENGGVQFCYVCNKNIPKEVYPKHVNRCIKRKEGAGETMIDCSDDEHDTVRSAAGSYRQTGKETESNTVEMDSDEIGNSPIKTFKLIGEGTGSNVDYNNQFSFLSSRPSARGGGRGRGNGRGRKKRYWKRRKK